MDTAIKTKKKKRWIKWVIIAAVVVVIVILLLLKGSRSVSSAGNYMLETAQKRDITVIVNSTGTIEPEISYAISPSVTAEILEMHVGIGDTVNEGDVICVLDSSDYETVLRQYQDSVKSAELSLEQARLSLDSAGNSLDSYAEAYGNLSVTASSRSQVTKLYFSQGESVSAGSPVAELLDSSAMLLDVPFNATDAQKISAGSDAKVTVLSSGDTLDGTVTKVSGVDVVTSYGGIVRTVTISVQNPGAVTESIRATASVGSLSCSSAGTFKYSESETIYAPASGKIGRINVPEGGWADAGGTILTIESNAVEGQYQSAQDSIKSAQLGVKTAEIALESAKLNLENAQETMDDYTVRAKTAGVVAVLNYDVGDTINPSLPVAEIFKLDTVKFDLKIDELDIEKITSGQSVSITADAVSDQTFTGVVSVVGINGSGLSGVTTYPVTVIVKKPGDLLPGMNVTADIIVDKAEGVLTIPVSAVSGGNTVLVPDSTSQGDSANGVPTGYRRVTLTLGRSDDNYTEVLDGLSEGNTVAIDNSTSSAWDYMGPQQSSGTYP